MPLVQILIALAQATKALGTGKRPPPGTKTVTVNVAALIAWTALRFGFDLPPEVVDQLAVVALVLGNLVLRAVTKGPLGAQAPGK